MAMGVPGDSLVTVFGASGFIGRHVVAALARQGWRIRAAERRPDLAGHLQPLGDVGQIQPVQANLCYRDSVRQAVEGADAVVDLVGILAESGQQSFEAVHIEGARAVAKAAAEAGAVRLVHVSAIGADPGSKSNYARSKAAGEAAVLEAFADAVILRPSVVFGPEDAFFNRFAAMAQFSPALPLIGAGRMRFQPVYVGDVGAAVAAALAGKAQPGTIYELGGPEILTFKEILRRVLTYTKRRRLLVYMPFWMAKLQALMTWPLPTSMRPVTVDQVRLLQRDNTVSEAAITEHRTLDGLGIDAPHAIETIVPTYLERFRPRGQFATYRL